MISKMRRKKKQLSEEKTIEVLVSCAEGVLATAGPDNSPYAVPLNYVYHKGSIYFHCADKGHKIDNIEHNSKVSFCVMKDTRVIPEKLTTKFKSVILFGEIQEVFDEEKEAGLLALVHRFSSDHLDAGKAYIEKLFDKTKVFKINIEHMTGKGTP
jgi:uncharacterized protein